MVKKFFAQACLIFLFAVNSCLAGACGVGTAVGAENEKGFCVERVLERLKASAAGLESYEGKIVYKFSQPLFESETVRKGVLYYQHCEERSNLRINFDTLKQDEDEEETYVEYYIFDGVWLTHVDWQIKEVKRYQQAEADEPVDGFELARRNFPIIGFSRTEDLKKEFEINLVEQEADVECDLVHLHLKVKSDSVYKDDYISVDFWIDKKVDLPSKIVAVSTEEDIYEIELLEAKVNEPIEEKVFDFEVPEGFGEPEAVPLEKKAESK